MRIIFPHSNTFAKEEALTKKAQQAQAPGQYDKWQVASIMLDAFSKIDPANQERFLSLKSKADQKTLTDAELSEIRKEISRELPTLQKSVYVLSQFIGKLPQ